MGADNESRTGTPENDQAHAVSLGWEATLSDGSVIAEDLNEVAAWRWLRDKCRKGNLKIAQLNYNGQPIYPNADGYFAFFDALAIAGGGSITRRAIGCVKCNDHGQQKVRVTWYEQGTAKQMGPTESHYMNGYESAEIAREMMIEREGAAHPAL